MVARFSGDAEQVSALKIAKRNEIYMRGGECHCEEERARFKQLVTQVIIL